MDKRRLGRTEIDISPIGLGCMQFSQGGLVGMVHSATSQDTVTSVVRAALAGGINWFDTAEMYGNGRSEQALTTALKHCDAAVGDVAVATKWSPLLRPASNIGRTIETRLSSLQGYPIDLHQVHMPNVGLSPIPAQMRAMARLLRAGQIRAVGVSNFSAKQTRQADEALRSEGCVLASNQVHINLLHRRIEDNGVLETARELGITLIAYSPLANGLLTGKFHENPELVRSLPRMRRMMGRDLGAKGLARTAPLIGELRTIARAHSVSAAQVALNWLITFYGDTVVAIPGASKPRQAEESAGAMDFHLTDKELARLDELSRR